MRFAVFLALIVCVAAKCGKGGTGCTSGNCCSYWGYCGNTNDYCGSGTYQCSCDCTAKGSCVSIPCQIRYCGKTTQIRKTASATGAVVKTIYRGDTVCFTDKTSTGWAKLNDGNYVYANDLMVSNPNPPTPPAPSSCTNYSITATANNRAGPSTTSKILKTFAKGATVCVVSISNTWALLNDGTYVSETLIGIKTTVAQLKFTYSAPSNLNSLSKYTLWATGYYTPAVNSGGSFALRTMNGSVLGNVSQKDWCNCAMQGSCTIVNGSSLTTISVAGYTDANTVSCSAYYPTMSGYANCRLKFAKSIGLFGNGAHLYVVPYRSVAVDKNTIPYGTVLYIPSARGTVVPLPDGRSATHDGYFIAADTGGAIKQNHIDVYFGNTNPITNNVFKSWVRSVSSSTFAAYKVTDTKIINEITQFSRGFFQ